MPNERGKSVDGTYLSIDLSENRFLIHRDYLAHAARWSFACKMATKMRGDLWVLDVGCGKEMPFAKLLYTNKIGANKYCGVEHNTMTVPDMLRGNGVFKIRLLKDADAALITLDHVSFQPNLVIMFEVFEHVEPRHGREILDNVKRLMRFDGSFVFSTPCFNGKAAGNHVAEPEYAYMGATLEDAGFAIVDHFGTFASIADYKRDIDQVYGDDGFKLFERLKEYYDVNFLATIFAPLFPSKSRNCLWNMVHVEAYKALYGCEYQRQFPSRLEVKPKWSPTGSSSSDDDVLDQDWYDRIFKEGKYAPEIVPETAPCFPETQDTTVAGVRLVDPNEYVVTSVTEMENGEVSYGWTKKDDAMLVWGMPVQLNPNIPSGTAVVGQYVAGPHEGTMETSVRHIYMDSDSEASAQVRQALRLRTLGDFMQHLEDMDAYFKSTTRQEVFQYYDDGMWPNRFRWNGVKLYGRLGPLLPEVLLWEGALNTDGQEQTSE